MDVDFNAVVWPYRPGAVIYTGTTNGTRQKIIAKGQSDAWVTGFVNGKRYTLEDLIMVDFLGKAIN